MNRRHGRRYAEALNSATFSVSVSDAGGAATSQSVNNFSVADAAITAGPASTVNATEGAAFSGVVGSFSDANAGADASDFTATITWGDGAMSSGNVTGSAGAFQVTGTHVYEDEANSLPISVTVHDAGGSAIALSGLANIVDAPLAPAARTFSAVSGTTFSGTVAAFTDANGAASAADFTATIDWGDGSSQTAGDVTAVAGGSFVVSGSHLYAQSITRSVAVIIQDVGGANATVASTAVFADVVASSSPVAIAPTEGANFSGTLAMFTGSDPNGSIADSDPNGSDADFTASISWGDGATSAGVISGSPGGGYSVNGTHAYAEAATSVPFAIIIHDKSGSATTIANATTIADAKLHLSTPEDHFSLGGLANNLVVATFTDDGGAEPADHYQATIDWGDGSTTAGTIVPSGDAFKITGSHAYAGRHHHSGRGTFIIHDSIADKGGGSDSLTEQATVIQSARHQYVIVVYQDVLGRNPDPDGLDYWTHLLDDSMTISSVAEAIAHSAEYYANFVIKPEYLKLLGRTADKEGVAFWTALMETGLTDQQLEAQFVAAAEFYAKAGRTNADWINAVYNLLLGRQADASGEAHWSAQLAAGLTRLQVALQIVGSTENNTQLINDDYFHYLGRQADPAGLAYWLDQFARGKTNEDVIAGFTGSDEYYKEHTR